MADDRLVDIDTVATDQVVAPSAAAEAGYVGFSPDTRPTEDYTLAGVTKALRAEQEKKASSSTADDTSGSSAGGSSTGSSRKAGARS